MFDKKKKTKKTSGEEKHKTAIQQIEQKQIYCTEAKYIPTRIGRKKVLIAKFSEQCKKKRHIMRTVKIVFLKPKRDKLQAKDAAKGVQQNPRLL